jgi:hypothetical protein
MIKTPMKNELKSVQNPRYISELLELELAIEDSRAIQGPIGVRCSDLTAAYDYLWEHFGSQIWQAPRFYDEQLSDRPVICIDVFGEDWRLILSRASSYHICAYCGAENCEDEIAEGWIPEVDEDQGWAKLALYHAQGCEWVQTRAHRIGGGE